MSRSVLGVCLVAFVAMAVEASTTYDAAGGTVYYTTTSTESYLCPSNLATGKSVVCGVAQYPAENTEDKGSVATMTCPAGTTFSCFLFASLGGVGGHCPGTDSTQPMFEDANWAPVPLAVANSCVGTQSCTLTMGASGGMRTVNDVATTISDSGPMSKMKVLAVCAGASDSSSLTSSSDSTATTTTTSGATITTTALPSVLLLGLWTLMAW